jgi:CheY-like chemotaxis protein
LIDYDLGSHKTGVDFFEEFLAPLKTSAFLHSGREEVNLDGLDLTHIRKPIGLLDFNKILDETNRRRPRILLLEDSKLIAIAWKMFHGTHNIIWFQTPQDALSYINMSKDIHVCVLDYYLEGEGMTGLDVANEIIKSGLNLPIFLMSSAQLDDSQFLVLSKKDYEVRNLI